jgi:hypothetical protein
MRGIGGMEGMGGMGGMEGMEGMEGMGGMGGPSQIVNSSGVMNQQEMMLGNQSQKQQQGQQQQQQEAQPGMYLPIDQHQPMQQESYRAIQLQEQQQLGGSLLGEGGKFQAPGGFQQPTPPYSSTMGGQFIPGQQPSSFPHADIGAPSGIHEEEGQKWHANYPHEQQQQQYRFPNQMDQYNPMQQQLVQMSIPGNSLQQQLQQQQQQLRFPNQMQLYNSMQQQPMLIDQPEKAQQHQNQIVAGLHQQQPGGFQQQGVTDKFQKVREERQGVLLGNHLQHQQQVEPLNKEELIQQQTFRSNEQQMRGSSQGLYKNKS